ncbi:hypothetical protein NDU88_005217 [Pleurodeles waltl]|uniref:Uncharacterized protein n=1 Tax=Pleurodeles waltl TaxID=8319 RepID=A0AAV7MIR4_PLEWA|nr:hypothetical protein NDU88_005217 [Pleurodeles waltl]
MTARTTLGGWESEQGGREGGSGRSGLGAVPGSDHPGSFPPRPQTARLSPTREPPLETGEPDLEGGGNAPLTTSKKKSGRLAEVPYRDWVWTGAVPLTPMRTGEDE